MIHFIDYSNKYFHSIIKELPNREEKYGEKKVCFRRLQCMEFRTSEYFLIHKNGLVD